MLIIHREFLLAPLSLYLVDNSGQHLISPYYMIMHTGHENSGNDHQRQNVLILKQFLPTDSVTDMEKSKENVFVDTEA